MKKNRKIFASCIAIVMTLCTLFSVAVVPASAASATKWVDVLETGNLGYATKTFYLQSKPDVLEGKDLVKVEKGTVVKILGKTGLWYKIEVYPKGNRYVGYIGQYAIADGFPCVARNFRVIATAGLNVRAGMSTSSRKLGALKYNAKVYVLKTSTDGWSQISYNGRIGYVATRYLKLA